MDPENSERLAALAGFIASAMVGVPVLFDTIDAGGILLIGPAWLWWTCYLGHLAAFATLMQLPAERRPSWLTDGALVVMQNVMGGAAYILAPGLGWAVVLLVVATAAAAYEFSRRVTTMIIVLHALLIAAVTFRYEMYFVDAVLTLVVYSSFLVFAVVVIWTQQREATARAHLAKVNAELEATTTLLEASGRTAERLRIARDLHDLIGHQLTALTLELEAATHASTPTETEHVARARRISKDLLGDVRQAVGELRVPQPALREALESVTRKLHHPTVQMSVDPRLEVDDATTLALVRCVQEIVTNTVRHAEARTLDIEVTEAPERGLRLAARDDGRGAMTLRSGNGLRGIRERIEALGGTVEFLTEPGRGMQVIAEVPRP